MIIEKCGFHCYSNKTCKKRKQLLQAINIYIKNVFIDPCIFCVICNMRLHVENCHTSGYDQVQSQACTLYGLHRCDSYESILILSEVRIFVKMKSSVINYYQTRIRDFLFVHHICICILHLQSIPIYILLLCLPSVFQIHLFAARINFTGNNCQPHWSPRLMQLFAVPIYDMQVDQQLYHKNKRYKKLSKCQLRALLQLHWLIS